MKKLLLIIIAAALTVSALVSCGTPVLSFETVAGTYSRDGESFIDSFSITLSEDGSFSYYQSMASSYIGIGEYTIDGSRVILTDSNIPTLSGKMTRVFVFVYSDGKLIFDKDRSENVPDSMLDDGEIFELKIKEDN